MNVLGITVFRDADSPTHYYHLPASPHLSRDAGGPMFDLFVYRKGGEGGQDRAGGFLMMTVDVGLADLPDRTLGKLKHMSGGDAPLGAVPFARGAVRIVALDAASSADGAPKLVQSVLASATPSFDEDN